MLQSIQDLEQQLTRALEANSSLNPLADLLDTTCSCKDPQEVSKGIYALYRVLVLAIGKGKLSAAGDDTVKAVKAWLWERMNTYVDYLCGLLKDDEKILRVRGDVHPDVYPNFEIGLSHSNPLFFTKASIKRFLLPIVSSIPQFAFPEDRERLAIMSFILPKILVALERASRSRRFSCFFRDMV